MRTKSRTLAVAMAAAMIVAGCGAGGGSQPDQTTTTATVGGTFTPESTTSSTTSTTTPSPSLYHDERDLAAHGYERLSFPSGNPGIPAYARLNPVVDQFFNNGEWLVVPFFRDPECIPEDFNLLHFFHMPEGDDPGAFGCQLHLRGRHWVGGGEFIPILAISEGDAVPIWFVDWVEFQSLLQTGVVRIGDLRSLSRRTGIATSFSEFLQPRVGEHVVIISAQGVLDDGGNFIFELVHIEDQTETITIEFD